MRAQEYSSEDVQQILMIAQAKDTFSEAQLQEMAHELVIDDSALRQAIATWQIEKENQRQKRQQRQNFYRQQLLPYLGVNTFLILLNVSIAGTVTWAIYPLLGWGISLFFGPCKSRHEKRFLAIHR